MSGIIGYWNWTNTFDIDKIELRGRDGTRVDNFNENVKILFSRAIPTTEFAEKGIDDSINYQPFSNDKFIVAYDGLISNVGKLIKKYKLKKIGQSNSSILPDFFKQVGVIKGLKLIEGNFAVVVFDKEKNIFYAGKNFVPLRIHNSNGRIKIASIKEMFCNEEDNIEIEPYTCYEIKKDTPIIKHSLYNRKRNKKVLVICSGGTDSVTTAYIYKYFGYDVHLLHFNYGQAAEEAETFAVKKIAKDLNASLKIIDGKPIFNMFKDVSVLLHQKKANEKDKLLDAESTLSYVPNRNAILAMIAAGIAEMNKIDTVAFGGQLMDAAYPDNNPTFVDAVDNLLKYSLNWQTNIKFSAPLINCMKHEIYQIGEFLNVNYNWVVSCYYPKIINNTIVPCKECGCCQFRINAMKMIGFEDEQSGVKKEKEKIKKIKNRKNFLDLYVKRWL